MAVPSTTILSLVPSSKPLTVNVRPVIDWPTSTVLTNAALNTATALACVDPAPSVKIGLDGVALKVGASLTAVMFSVTVSTSVRVPPVPVLPRSLVVTVRVTAPFALAAVV